jgi:hypothetical protein
MSWYSTIANDITRLHDGILYFQTELTNAKYECKIVGNVEKASAAMPGIVEQRYNQLQEIEAILEFLNIELKRLKSFHFRKYLETYARALSSRDCEKFVEGEDDVIEYEQIINEFALLRNQWLGITKALDQKSYALSNIIRLRCAGMEDATI